MALGFGFNKAKVLNSAEKYVQQGKLQHAIHEYEKVTRQDPRDLTVLNTIGDLYARIGQPDRAASYFRKVGDFYAADGFTVKAIAMYKKLTKLAPSSTDALHKLAELYTQQGLYTDARQQYVALADFCMKANDLESAAHVFHKMLELDPDNSAMQSKLADLYIRMGRKDEARDIYFRAAESLYQRAALDAADEALGRVLSLDPSNVRVLLKRAQIALESGDTAGALHHLDRIPDIDSNPGALGVLLRLRLESGSAAEAEQIARKLAANHADFSGIQALANWLMSTGACQQGLTLYGEFSSQLAVSNAQALEHALETSLLRVKEDAASLEVVRRLYAKLGDKSHVNECTELLAHALVNSGDLQRARDLYRELADSEPENPTHQQQYRQVLAKLGEDASVRPLTEEEGSRAFMVDELEISAPEVEQHYPDDIKEAISSALTESELLDSYNLTDKAVKKLEEVLPKAPRDIGINQRLASLYAQTNRLPEAAACCDILEAVYREASFTELAEQYREMAAKYRQRTTEQPSAAEAQPVSESAPASIDTPPAEEPVATQAESAAAPEVPAPLAEPHPAEAAAEPDAVSPPSWVPPAEPAPAETPEQVHVFASADEIDLSDEWESHTASAPIPAPDLSMLQAQVAAATAHVPEIELESPVAELGIAWAPSPSPAEEQVPAAAASTETPAPEVIPSASATQNEINELVAELEQSLGSDFGDRIQPPAAVATTPLSVTLAPLPAVPVTPMAVSAPPAPVAAAVQIAPPEDEAVHALSEIFAEFKQEAEAGTDQLEDPETHYNLGCAFREMGLMDEAIGELQKVSSAIDRGAEFPHVMQTYTWLAQCFVEKGVPEASFKWYERALKVSTDEQQRMSLHYDLAGAYEAAGNRSAALGHFMEVYGSNIDYRDVAERIKALRS